MEGGLVTWIIKVLNQRAAESHIDNLQSAAYR